MKNRIQSVPIDKLAAHPDNPNRMSKAVFARLVRNIARTGRYEPLVVRPKDERFQIINGHNRLKALEQLGFESVDVVVWDVDDTQTRILMGSLNRLCGSDVLDKKVRLLKELSKQIPAGELAKLLPQTATQIERLSQLADKRREGLKRALKRSSKVQETIPDDFKNPLMFFLSDEQNEKVERAMSLASEGSKQKTKAATNAAALTHIVEKFIDEKADE